MTGSKGIARLLDRHKIALSREIDASSILQHLVKKGVLSHEDERRLVSERNVMVRSDLLVEMFAHKGFNAFRELCMILELECPHLLTSLLLDSAGRTKSAVETKVNKDDIPLLVVKYYLRGKNTGAAFLNSQQGQAEATQNVATSRSRHSSSSSNFRSEVGVNKTYGEFGVCLFVEFCGRAS